MFKPPVKEEIKGRMSGGKKPTQLEVILRACSHFRLTQRVFASKMERFPFYPQYSNSIICFSLLSIFRFFSQSVCVFICLACFV